MYSPSKVSLKGLGVLTPSLSKSTDAISTGSVAAFLTQNSASFIDRDYSYKGKYFKLHFPTKLNLHLNRRLFLSKNQTRFVEAMNNDLRHWLRDHVDQMRLIAADVVTRLIYETDAETVNITKSRSKTQIIKSFQGTASDESTGNLRQAVMDGISFSGYELSIGIDEELAPYWIWVERGHRVVLPGGVETGNFVRGRPFMDAIFEALNDYIDSNVIPVIQEYIEHVMYVTGEWVIGNTAAVRNIKYPVK